MKKILSSLLLALLFAVIPSKVFAGTDLLVSCANEGPCEILPANTPLFEETNMMPGDQFEQILTVENNDTNDTCNLVLDVTDDTEEQEVNLAERIFAAIDDGTTTYIGSLDLGVPEDTYTYQDLYDADPISLGSLAPLTSRDFTWYALFDFTAGNEYQGVSSIFDFEINITCEGGVAPTPTPSDGGGTSGGGNSSGGGGGDASPPQCHDQKPDGAPFLSATATGANTVELTWTPVSPVTHYALEFYRVSDGERYGSVNIGNVTNFTVTNLSGGGASYRFQVIPINGCMPGDRSNEAEVTPTGGELEGRPTGGGQVLGVTEVLEESPEPESSPEPSPEPQVLGEATDACVTWKWYLPWILLIAQIVLILAADYYLRSDTRWTKQYIAIGITLASIVIFYLLRQCQCYEGAWWFLNWLCKWYWLVALGLTVVGQVVNYAFIEEPIEKPEDRKKKSEIKDTSS